MSNSYTVLPAFYDFFGQHPDYEAIAGRVTDVYKNCGAKESGLILDLACGTGKLTLALLRRACDVIGTDLSPEMLSVARENCAKEGFFPLLLQQDMRQLDLYGTVDAAVCADNSLNYLESVEDLQKVFGLVHTFLTPGGLFFFDVNSLYKFETLYADNAYVFEGNGGFCVWQNEYRSAKKECRFLLTLFEKQKDGRYCRKEESQKQRYFSPRTIRRALQRAGFSLLSECADYFGTPAGEKDEAIVYTARCEKPEKERNGL